MKHIFDKITPGMKPLIVAVVCPVDDNSLRGASDAAKAQMIIPVLIGSEAKIRKTADEAGLDISGFEIVPAGNNHAAAWKAAELVRDGHAEALMKGAISTDEFLGPVVAKENRLRTDRRMSHVLIMEDPGYHKPLYVADGAMNPLPTLADKIDILQNTIDLFRVIEGRAPKVAVLTASEHIDPKQPATLDAAALAVMSTRGQISGAGFVEGPLSFDIAVSKEAARVKGVKSDVAGDPDIFLFPGMDTANIFVKSRMQFSGAKIGGVVVGARVPIILTSRADGSEQRMSSSAIALLSVRNSRA
ncbi:MAG: bifunctional enoyl-CoA hydratase/phosphate acetyltransferase [Pseudomonadota bacterium]